MLSEKYMTNLDQHYRPPNKSSKTHEPKQAELAQQI